MLILKCIRMLPKSLAISHGKMNFVILVTVQKSKLSVNSDIVIKERLYR